MTYAIDTLGFLWIKAINIYWKFLIGDHESCQRHFTSRYVGLGENPVLSKHSYCNVILRIFKKCSGIIWVHYIFFHMNIFPSLVLTFQSHCPIRIYRVIQKEWVKRSPWTLNLGPMKTVLLFFFLDDDDPVLQVGLELRDYESESGRKQSFSYDVSWTQLRSDIVLWCKSSNISNNAIACRFDIFVFL